MLVDVLDEVAAAVEAVVVDDDGEGIGVLHGLAVVGHVLDAVAGGSRSVDLIGEALAGDNVVVRQAALDAEGAVLVGPNLGGGVLEPGADFLAAHGDLVEPVLIAVQAEHVAELDVTLRDEVLGIAGGQRSGDGQLSGLIVGLVVGGVLTGAVISAPDLDLVHEVDEGGRRSAEARGGEVVACGADGLEHVLVPRCILIGLQSGGQLGLRLIEGLRGAALADGHGSIGGFDRVGLRGLVVGEQRAADNTSLRARGDDGDLLAVGVGNLRHTVAMLVAGEHKVDGVRGGDKLTDEVGLFGVAVDAAVADEDNEVGLGLHLGFVVLVGLHNACEVDALPVLGDIPVRDVGVADAHDSDLDAVIFLDDIGSVAVPGLPVAGLVVVRVGVEVVRHGNTDLGLGLGGLRGEIVQLALENIHAVVELVVADDPHIIVHHTHDLHGGIVHVLLHEGVVVRQRRALDGVAGVAEEYVLVFRTLLLDIGSDAGHALIMGAGQACILRVVRCKLLTMDVGGVEEEDLDLILISRENGRHQRRDKAQHKQQRHDARKCFLHGNTLLFVFTPEYRCI